jgi:hypothetical protein
MGIGGSSFSLDLSKFAKKAMGNWDLVIKKVVFDIFTDIVWLTPVDTGRARGGWQIGSNYKTGESGILDKSGMAALSSGTSGVAGLLTRAQVIGFIYNNVIYIGLLEDGSSKQAPRGMVKVTLTRTQAYLERAVASL